MSFNSSSIRTYGRRAAPSARVYAAQFSQNINDDENTGVSSESAVTGTRNPLGNIPENTLMSTEPEAAMSNLKESRKRKPQLSLDDIIREGHDSDRVYLLEKIDEWTKKDCQSHTAFSRFFIKVPAVSRWPLDDINRLKSWLERLGFVEDLLGKEIVYKFGEGRELHISELKRLILQAQQGRTGYGIGFGPTIDISFGTSSTSSSSSSPFSTSSHQQNSRPRIENNPLARSTESLPEGASSSRQLGTENEEYRSRSKSVDVCPKPSRGKNSKLNINTGLGAAGAGVSSGSQAISISNSAQTALSLAQGPFSTGGRFGSAAQRYNFPARPDTLRQDSEDLLDRPDTPAHLMVDSARGGMSRVGSSSSVSSPGDSRGQIGRTDSFTNGISMSPFTVSAASSMDSMLMFGMMSPRESNLAGLLQNQMKLNSNSKRASPVVGPFTSSADSVDHDEQVGLELGLRIGEATHSLQDGVVSEGCALPDDAAGVPLTQLTQEEPANAVSDTQIDLSHNPAEDSDTSTILDTSIENSGLESKNSSTYLSPVTSFDPDEDDEEITGVGQPPESAIHVTQQKTVIQAPLVQFASPFGDADGAFVPSASIGSSGTTIAKPSGVRPGAQHAGGIHGQHHVAFSEKPTIFDIPSSSSSSSMQPLISGSLSSPNAVGDAPPPPCRAGSAFGAINRTNSDEDLKMHGLTSSTFQRRSTRTNAAAERPLRNTKLTRSQTMPIRPTNSLKPADPETPCGVSLSQGDAGNYCTPSRDNSFATSGTGKFDWGDSHPAPFESIARYLHKLGLDSSTALKRCQSAMGNLENSSFYASAMAGAAAAAAPSQHHQQHAHVQSTPDGKVRAVDDSAIYAAGGGGSGGSPKNVCANGKPAFAPVFGICPGIGVQVPPAKRKPVTPIASYSQNSATKGNTEANAERAIIGLKPAFAANVPPLPTNRRRMQDTAEPASVSIPMLTIPPISGSGTGSLASKRASPYHMEEGMTRNVRSNSSSNISNTLDGPGEILPTIALRRSYSDLSNATGGESIPEHLEEGDDEKDMEDADEFNDDPVAKSRKIVGSLLRFRERSPVPNDRDFFTFPNSMSSPRLTSPFMLGNVCAPGVALATNGAQDSRNHELQKKRREKNSASKFRRMSRSRPVNGRQRKESISSETIRGLQALSIAEDSEEDSNTLLSPAAKAKADSSSRNRARGAARRESSADSDYEDRMDMLASGRPSFPPVEGDEMMACGGGASAIIHESSRAIQALENSYSDDAHKQSEVGDLSEANFSGIIIGGTYQHCFEGAEPVIAPPSSSDKRVVGVTLGTEDALTLSLYLPMDDQTKTIRLGKSWRWLRASPCGFIVSKGTINAKKKAVCYYLPKHPYDWTDHRDSRGSHGTRGATRNFPHAFAGGREAGAGSTTASRRNSGMSVIMDCSMQNSDTHAALNISPNGHEHDAMAIQDNSPSTFAHHGGDSTEHLLFNAICAQETSFASSTSDRRMNDSEIMIFSHPEHDVDDIDNEMHSRFAAAVESRAETDEAVSDIVNARRADWNNSSIVTLVLEFLLGDNISGPVSVSSAVAAAGGGGVGGGRSKRGGKNSRRTQDEDANREDKVNYRAVSKSWALGSYRLLARHLSSSVNCQTLPYRNWAAFVQRHPRGKYLSEGACKTVYCVENTVADTVEAISVMNVDDLQERGADTTVAQELEISMLCSSLVSLNICPNLVQVHTVFRSNCPPPKVLWESDPQVDRRPRNPTVGFGNVVAAAPGAQTGAAYAPVNVPKEKDLEDRECRQYIRMEYCSGGDLEDLVRRNDTLDLNTVRSMLFQMFFAMYTCREKLALRHFDVKLLNFFVCEGSSLLPQRRRHDIPAACSTFCDSSADFVDMQIGFGQHIFTLQLQASGLSLVKLADFGTSAVGLAGLGDTITEQQFTTLENTPPEYLIAGSACRQAFSADTFPLGLCMLHLLTGKEPYEELLKSVSCPPYLKAELQKFWETDNIDSPYYVIGEVMRSLDDGSSDNDTASDEGAAAGSAAEPSAPGDVLYNTIYRYLVLFGVSAGLEMGSSASPWNDNPVWRTLLDALNLLGSQGQAYIQSHPLRSSGGRKGRAASTSARAIRLKQECIAQFERDRHLWSVESGAHELMISLRERLRALGQGSDRLFESLVHFDPARRCSMHEAILNPTFSCYRNPTALFAPNFHSARSATSRSPSRLMSRHSSQDHLFRDRASPMGSPMANDSLLRLMHYYRPSTAAATPGSLSARGEFSFPYALQLAQLQVTGTGADTLPIL